VSDEDVRQALLKIQERIDPKAAAAKKNEGDTKKRVLVVDDIGVVTYQLKVLFEKNGFDADTSRDIYTAIEMFKKDTYDYVITDLFVSTEREGFLLLDKIKKLIISKGLNTKIVVMTASNKGEYKIKCVNKGANAFIEKDGAWQEELLKICN
jgi:CheY-like chemotaxis protein